jgi:hypothetical protein
MPIRTGRCAFDSRAGCEQQTAAARTQAAQQQQHASSNRHNTHTASSRQPPQLQQQPAVASPAPKVPRQLQPQQLCRPQRQNVAHESAAVSHANAVAHNWAVVVKLSHTPAHTAAQAGELFKFHVDVLVVDKHPLLACNIKSWFSSSQHGCKQLHSAHTATTILKNTQSTTLCTQHEAHGTPSRTRAQ